MSSRAVDRIQRWGSIEAWVLVSGLLEDLGQMPLAQLLSGAQLPLITVEGGEVGQV